ncbi:fused MFS/spermidine synthase [Longimicrobium sp.]|uniref:fused MFS/spermidine synthase n=1 Tax=Longimicrobium sp. TaxID=2029185 RepID=UPI002B5E2A57|nr:fused MFS/spermidine synthase [Longimicrobium sp.]HSU16423.1 fused MFS/spermidine synthase [Longimicrobium sp.]
MSRDLLRRLSAYLRPVLLGAALAVVAFTGGTLMLYEARGALPAAGGLLATFAAALAAGLWAGAGADEGDDEPDRAPAGRWILVGIALGVAGVIATVWRVYEGERMGGAARALGLLFIVGIPVYAMGYLLPGLQAWESLADEDAVDGEAGMPAASFVVAVLAGITIGAALAGLVLLPRFSPGILLLGTAAVVTFPLAYPRRGQAAATERTLLMEEQTPFGTLRVEEIAYPGKRQPERRLSQNGEIESGELVRTGAPTFAYIAAAEWLFGQMEAPGLAYLCLGGGAYTLPRRIAERDPRARITVVELDPEVTRAAYRWFGLRPEHGVHSIHGDARMVAQGLPDAAFDRVFLDVYDGTESVPYTLVTLEALRGFSRLLRPGGVVVMNVIGVAEGEGDRRFWSTVRTAREAFGSVRLYQHLGRDFPDRQNFLIAASPEAGVQFPPAAGVFERWDEAEWPRLAGTTVFRDRYADPQERRAPLPSGDGPRPALAADREPLQAEARPADTHPAEAREPGD